MADQQLAFRIHMQSYLFVSTTAYQISRVIIPRQVDLFIPEAIQEPRERLDQIIELMNIQTNNTRNFIPNFNQIRALF